MGESKFTFNPKADLDGTRSILPLCDLVLVCGIGGLSEPAFLTSLLEVPKK